MTSKSIYGCGLIMLDTLCEEFGIITYGEFSGISENYSNFGFNLGMNLYSCLRSDYGKSTEIQ